MSTLPLIAPLIAELHAALRANTLLDPATHDALKVSVEVQPPMPVAEPIIVAAAIPLPELEVELPPVAPAAAPTVILTAGGHHFEDGWCVDCGISEEAFAARAYKCETVENARPQRAKPAAGRSMHLYGNGNRCQKCGIRRDVANSPYCQAS